MPKKNGAIENIDEQIKKLSQKPDGPSEQAPKEVESTKVFNNIEDTDTKIFDDEESITELLDITDDETKKTEVVIENVESNEKKEEVKTNIKKENNYKNKKKISTSKIIIVILVIVILILCGVGGFFIYKYFSEDEKPTVQEEKELTDFERAEAIKHYGEALEGIIGVYYSQQQVILEYDDAVKLVEFDKTVKCSVHEIYKDGKLYLNKCSVNGIKTDAVYGEKQEEVESSGEILEVYVSKVGKVATLSKPNNTAEYDTYTVDCGEVYYDPVLLADYRDYVFYFDSEYQIQMKNFKTDEKVFENLNYKQVLPIKTIDGSYDTNYIAVNINDYWGIYSLVDNSQVISPMYSWFSSAIGYASVGVFNSVSAAGNNLLVASDGKNYGMINYTNNKTIISFDYKQLYKSGNYIWARDNDDIGYIYDTVGNRYLTEEYDEIYGMVNGIYILARQGDDVKLVQIDGKVLYNYGKIENIGGVNYSLSYNDGPLFQFVNSSDNNQCIEVLYDPSTKEGSFKNAMCGGMAKPVLYLYPEKTTNITVSFERTELLETTYPKFTGKWEVIADNEGNLVDKFGKKYYALYWDEKRVHEVDFSEGFYVEKEEAILFLEEKLSYIGLNDYERNEFIMYWLPILEKNEKNLIYFELTEERESYNKLNISPVPDSLLRVGIHVKKVDKKVNIKKQSLIKFQRKGFVAVEWGGMIY